jgi:hypothetical protein
MGLRESGAPQSRGLKTPLTSHQPLESAKVVLGGRQIGT